MSKLSKVLKETGKGLGALLDSINALSSKSVLVGVPSSENARSGNGEPTNAEIAYIQNFGSPELNIPAREFMAPGIKAAQPQIVKALKLAGRAEIDGKDPEKYLNMAGLVAQSAVKAKITSGPFQALSARTLQARRGRGKTSEKPLIDTGQLRNAITYVIRD